MFECWSAAVITADSIFQEKHPKFWDFLKNSCTKLIKILITIQKCHPYSFGDKSVLPVVTDFCLNTIIDPRSELLSFEQFLIQCMSMVKTILECKEYKPNLTGRVMGENGVTFEKMKENMSSLVAGVVSSLLPSERVVVLCNILIRRYRQFSLFIILQVSSINNGKLSKLSIILLDIVIFFSF